MSNFYVCKDGKLVARDPEKSTSNKPTVITYNHTIRKLYESHCNCKEEVQRMKIQFQNQLGQKEKQIQALVNRIVHKQLQIDNLEKQILTLRKSDKLYLKEAKNTLNDVTAWEQQDKSLNSTTLSTSSLCDMGSNQNIVGLTISKTERQMQQCFKKTNSLMNQIEGIMKKKKKYEFHNAIQIQNSIIQELQNSFQKSQQDTQQIMTQETFYLPSSEYNDYDSLDMTNYESNCNFEMSDNRGQSYEKLLDDSISLKHAIIQMRQESIQEVREIQSYYQKQLKISYEQLEKERQKNALIEITKYKLNYLQEKGRQALVQLDLDENTNWDAGQNQRDITIPKQRLSQDVLSENPQFKIT